MVVNRCYHTSAQSHVCGWQIPLKLLHPQDPPNPETRIPRYKFKSNQNPRLNLHREMPRKLSFSMWWISGCCIFSGNCHTWAPSTISRRSYRRYRRRSAYFRTIGHLQALQALLTQICVLEHHRHWPSTGVTRATNADLRTGWRRRRGWPIFIRHFPHKSPIIRGSFAENNLQSKTSYESSPHCTWAPSTSTTCRRYGVAIIVGSFNLYVSFAKEPYKRDYILQKRHIILRSLLIVAIPYRRYRRGSAYLSTIDYPQMVFKRRLRSSPIGQKRPIDLKTYLSKKRVYMERDLQKRCLDSVAYLRAIDADGSEETLA